jgi:probable HAF family extracellular repeat protein
MTLRAICLAAVAIASASLSPLKAQNYTFQVAECGAYTVYPEGMNSEGTVVGAAQTIDSTYSLAFYYANGVCKVISLGTTGTSFLGITDNNEIPRALR